MGRYCFDICQIDLSTVGQEHNSSPGQLDNITIVSIPREVLLHIFRLLNISDRLSIASVCRTWRCLIFSSACLWEKQHFVLKCRRESHENRRSCFYTEQHGHFFRKLTIKSELPHKQRCVNTVVWFQKLIMNLKTKDPDLESFKVINLFHDRTRQKYVARICSLLTQLLETLTNLKSFQMSSTRWPLEKGKTVMAAFLKVSRNTIETLQIDEFFQSGTMPTEKDYFTGLLTSLPRLTKLAITYYYLTEDTVIALANSRRGQLKKLKLEAVDMSAVNPNVEYISTKAWQHLTSACPGMTVEICCKGTNKNPSTLIPAMLDRALRIYVIHLSYMGNENMKTVFDYIMAHSRTLERLEIINPGFGILKDDADLINMVRQCEHLIHLEVDIYVNDDQTPKIVKDIIAKRTIKKEKEARKRPRDPSTSLATASPANGTTISSGVAEDGNSASKKSKLAP